jgi:hypothetical protein
LTSAADKGERLLFFSFAAHDVDRVLSTNFDVQHDGLDGLGGIPFSETPSLTIGHGQSGLLLCRVLLGKGDAVTQQDFLAGKSKAVLTGNCDSVTVTGGDSEIFVVKNSDQILPYSIIRLKESLTAETIDKYLTKNDGKNIQNGNGSVAGAASLNHFLSNSSPTHTSGSGLSHAPGSGLSSASGLNLISQAMAQASSAGFSSRLAGSFNFNHRRAQQPGYQNPRLEKAFDI